VGLDLIDVNKYIKMKTAHHTYPTGDQAQWSKWSEMLLAPGYES